MSKVDRRFIKWGAGVNDVNMEHMPDGTTRFAITNTDQTIDGVKTFNAIPIVATTPTQATQVVNKSYVDSQILAAVQGLSWKSPVDERLADPDAAAVKVNGTRVLVTEAGTGAGAGHNNAIATYDGSAWTFETPSDNWAVLVKSNDEGYTYDSTTSAWIMFSSGALPDGSKAVKGKLQVGDGLAVASGVVSVDLDAAGGLQFTGTSPDQKVAVKLDPAGALVVDATGVKVALEATNPTLKIADNKLGLNIKAGAGLAVDATGVYVDPSVLDTSKYATVTLTAQNITDKFVDLSETVKTANTVQVQVVGGPLQAVAVDFNVINDAGSLLRRISWNGLGLDGILEAGDVLQVWYSI